MSETQTENDNPGLIMPPPLMLLIGLVIAVILEFLIPMQWLPEPGFPHVLSWLGLLICAGSVALAYWAISTFRAARTHPEPWKPSKVIVLGGPYRFTRNPMYLGMTLALLGIALMFRLEWGIILTPVLLLAYDRLVVTREEAYLTRKFGPSYQELLGRTRRWL